MDATTAVPKFRSIHLVCTVIALGFGFHSGLTTNEALSGMKQASRKASSVTPMTAIVAVPTTSTTTVMTTIPTADELQEYYKWKAEQQQQQQQEPTYHHEQEQEQQQQQQEQQCRHTLDKLDTTFNERRNARIRRMAATRRPPNPIPFFDLFEPEAICFTEERFGSMIRYDAFGDGPKFACGIDYLRETTTTTPNQTENFNNISHNNDDKDTNNANPCLVYSVGSNNQIAFEQSVSTILPGCEIHTFDPTLTKPFIGDAYSMFHPWGIGENNGTVTFRQNTFHTKSFEQIIHDLNHIGRPINILKIDCEGCEYTAMVPLFELITNKKVQIDQILIELHNEPKWSETPDIRWKRLIEFFEAADRAKMRIYHKERNQWGCHGAYCVEYALVSEDFLRRSNAQIVCDGNDSSSSSSTTTTSHHGHDNSPHFHNYNSTTKAAPIALQQ